MNRTAIILMLIFNISLVYSQPFVFKKHIIDSTINGCSGLFSGDIDKDGDIDISGTSVSGDKIHLWLNRHGTNPPVCWWENQLITARDIQDLTKDEVIKELEIIHTSLKEIHAGFTLYRTEADIKAKYDSIFNIINTSDIISYTDCLSLYQELTNYINCGHTTVYDPLSRIDNKDITAEHDRKEIIENEIVENGTCKLVLPTFYTVELRKNGIRYKNYLKSFFREADKKKCNEIIIDIRGNRGGSVHMAAYLASFIIDSCFIFFNSVELKDYKRLTCDKYIEKDAFYRFRRLITSRKENKRYYRLHRELRQRKPHRLSPGPEVNIKILIDNKTFSAATMFAAVCRSKSDAVFIGKETAGKCIGSGLSPVKLILPYSYFIVEIPLAYIYLSTNNLDQDQLYRGVLPDSIPGY